MPVAAQRFKFLDHETNIPVANLKDIVENAVYNAAELVPSEFSLPSEEDLKFLTKSLEELSDSFLEKIDLNSVVEKAISSFESLELPDIVSDALNFLKNLDLGSLKNFFKDVLDIGMNFLCNNLDFLKLFLLGFSLSGDVLAGLLIGFLLSLLDSICDSYFSKDRIENTSNKDILDALLPIKNDVINQDIAFSKFEQCMADFNFISDLEQPSNFDNNNFLSSVLVGTKESISDLVSSLTNNSSFFESKDSLLSEITNNLSNYLPGSKEFNNLLYTKGIISNLPTFSPNTSLANIMKDNLSLELGKLAKSLPTIEINPIKQLGLDEISKDIFDNFVQFKQTVITEKDLFKSLELNSNSFINIDFGSMIPSMTNEIKNKLKDTFSTKSHKWRDLSPTTEIVLDNLVEDTPELYYA